ncbi:MAG: hypothetical protein OEO82_02685 [Gammaproteobacteria bacterium]|nr:hypothetical protein [Gammaproteobacteria bacterium]
MKAYLFANRERLGRLALLALAVIVLVSGLQAALFFGQFTPRMARANADLFDLMVEESQRKLLRGISVQVEMLSRADPDAESDERTLADAWDEFLGHFAAGPREAVAMLSNDLPGLTAGVSDAQGAVSRLTADVARLSTIYADSYKELLADLKRPPAYLWPTAPVIASRSGYVQSATLNRALYLAQTGEIGTARVMLAGLNASVEDPEMLGTIYYTLGRLQFELFAATPEAEYFTQALQYLRQSLEVDPDMQLARRLLDYLLSLPQAAAAPQASEGRPETPAEGEGAAVSAEKRVF